jgi:hypothetical protein
MVEPCAEEQLAAASPTDSLVELRENHGCDQIDENVVLLVVSAEYIPYLVIYLFTSLHVPYSLRWNFDIPPVQFF